MVFNMEKVIKIDLINEKDLINNYDENKLSNNLLEYIIKEALYIKRKDMIKIIINNKCNTKKDYKEMFINAFKEEYKNNLKIHNRTNIVQLILLIIGIFFIFLSFQINNEIWKEIFLISGWVPIWEMIELELFNDVRDRKRKRVLLKLINSKIDD